MLKIVCHARLILQIMVILGLLTCAMLTFAQLNHSWSQFVASNFIPQQCKHVVLRYLQLSRENCSCERGNLTKILDNELGKVCFVEPKTKPTRKENRI